MTLPLTQQAHQFVARYVAPGDAVIDATAGNGHDTLFLARLTGTNGQVFAFDNQAQAIAATRARLEQAGEDKQVRLFCCGHEYLNQAIEPMSSKKISAVMFNLGYLPGSDRSHTTDVNTTLRALEQALSLLAPGGIISIIAYTGHPEGQQETEQIKHWLKRAKIEHQCTISDPVNPASPQWIVIVKN